MQSDVPSAPTSKAMRWTGYAVSAAPALMLCAGGIMKLMGGDTLKEGFDHLGWDANLAIGLAIVELSCTLFYLIPQTAVLGAILLTGYMGGAIATHVRIGEPFVMQLLLGMVVWLGLYLRDARIRALIPLLSRAA